MSPGVIIMEFITTSKELILDLGRAASAAKSADPCLIIGEKGAGRTQFARFIHEKSRRAAEPFVIFDLEKAKNVEKELFGEIKRGLLTGENFLPGAIESAGGGTLLIKGLHLLPIDLQPQMAATIQLGGYPPDGGGEPLKALCRFIFTSPFEKAKLEDDKKVQPELMALFLMRTFRIPPLKERAEDIERLSEWFLKKWSNNLNLAQRKFTKQALRLLKRSKWPGNAAELERTILRAVIHFDVLEIDAPHLQLKMDGNWTAHTDEQLEEIALEEIIEKKLGQFVQRLGRYDIENLHSAVIERVERPLVRLAMERSKNNQLKAARMLGINRNTLRTKLQKLDII